MAERRRGGCGVTLAVLPVAALLVGGLLAAYAPDATWLLQLAAIGLPYAAWAAVPLIVALLLARRRGGALALAVLVALVGVRAWPGTGAGTAEGDLVLTTFNFPTERDLLGVLADSSTAFATRTAPHILAMQDTWVYPAGSAADQPPQVRALVEDGSPYAAFVPSRLVPRDGWQRRGTSTPLLVRTRPRRADPGAGIAEVLEQHEIALNEGDDETSVALRSRVRWQGREAVLYNVHMRSYGHPKPWTDTSVVWLRPSTWWPYGERFRDVFAARHADADRLAARIAAERLPVIVVGDFNSTADHYTYRRLRRARDGAPFTDAHAAAGGWRWGRTYHARRPLVRIDYVLVDPEAFEVGTARTLPVTFSDHRPVEVRLRWREAAER